MSELDAFDYALPKERIAQEPSAERDAARLLVLERDSGEIRHRTIRDLPELLDAGDLLVTNTSRVLPARLRGAKSSGGAAEALLLGTEADGRFRALVKCRGRLREGQKFRLGALDAELLELGEDGEALLAVPPGSDPYAYGEPPLPPYIRRPEARPIDVERYQAVYAREPGSVAAPTAGLHFTDRLLEELERAGIERAAVVLHVGVGTFRPLRDVDLESGELHAEPWELPEATALAVARTRERGGRVIAVGTTATRVLESRADEARGVRPGSGETRLFLRPQSDDDTALPFGAVDGLLTNFHLPRSSLLLLVAAFAGRRRILDAYAEAIREGYRFYSYGDAMLIL